MWDCCHEGKSLSASKLCSPENDVITDWLKSLPQEIIPNILIRLPIKSLIKFTSVSKTWSSTIKNPTFIQSHLTHKRNSNDQNATHLILFHTVFTEGYFFPIQFVGFNEDSYSLHYDNNNAVTEYSKILFPIVLNKRTENQCFRVVGTCNGLVLLADDLEFYAYNFVIWNPRIRKYVTLPEPDVRFLTHGEYEASLGIGYDAIGNDYKVVRQTTLLEQRAELPRTIAQVYSLATGSWGMLIPLEYLVTHSWVFVNGVLHWLAVPWRRDEDRPMNHVVLTFDVAGESIGEIMLPKSFEWDAPLDLSLSVSGDRKSIALFVSRCEDELDYFLDIWLMNEYAVETSWTKLMILTPQGPAMSLPNALCFRRNGELMLVYKDGHELASLDVVSKEVKYLGISGGLLCFADSYEESLLLLDRKDAASY